MIDILDNLASQDVAEETATATAQAEQASSFQAEYDRLEAEMLGKPGTVIPPNENGETPDADEPQDNQAESQEAEGEDDAASEATADAADTETEDSQEPAEPAFDVMAELFELSPDIAIESIEELPGYVNQIQQDLLAYRDFEQLAARSPKFMELANILIKGDEIDEKAAYKVFGDALRPPDKDEDPEGYHKWELEMVRADAERKAYMKQQEDRSSTERKQVEARKEDLGRQLQALARTEKLTPAETRAFAKQVQAFIFGDPVTGRTMPNVVKNLYAALNSEKAAKGTEKEIEAAEQRGFNRAMKQLSERKKSINQPPNLTNQPGGDITDAPADKEVREFAQSIKDPYGGGDFLDRLREKPYN